MIEREGIARWQRGRLLSTAEKEASQDDREEGSSVRQRRRLLRMTERKAPQYDRERLLRMTERGWTPRDYKKGDTNNGSYRGNN